MNPPENKRLSVSLFVTLILVVVTTLFLGGMGLAGYRSFSAWEREELRANQRIVADQLAASLALAVWGVDLLQIDSILSSALKNPEAQTVAVRFVDDARPVQAMTRNAAGVAVPALDFTFPEASSVETRNINYSGQELGAVQVLMTEKLLDARLGAARKWFLIVVAGLDALLVLVLQQIFWRAVLKPLKNIERYTAAVCAGNAPEAPVGAGRYLGELERVREATEQMVALLDARYRALSRNQSMLEGVLNSVPMAVFWKDRDGRFLGCNGVLARMAGLRAPAEIVGKTDFDLPWPKTDSQAYRQDDMNIMQTLVPKVHIIDSLQQADGQRSWIDTTKTPLLDEHGRAYGLLAVFEDITERKRGEEALRAAHDRLVDIVEFLPDATFVIDRDGKVIAWNRAIELLTGVPKDEVLGTSEYSTAIYGARRPALIDFLSAPLGEHAAQYQHLRRAGDQIFAEGFLARANRDKGAHLWAVAAPLYNQSGDHWGAIEVIRDVTERVQADERLRENEAKLRALTEDLQRSRSNLSATIESTEDMIWSVDEDGRLITANSNFVKHFNKKWGADLKEGDSLGKWLPEGVLTHWKEMSQRAIEQGPFRVDSSLSEGRQFEIAFHPITQDDRTTGVSIFAKDVTEHKALESALSLERRFFEALFEGLPGHAFVLDESGIYLRWNRNFEQTYGAKHHQKSHFDSMEHIHPRDRGIIRDAVREAFATGAASIEFLSIRADGFDSHREATIQVFEFEGIRYGVGVSIDVTERNRAENALRSIVTGTSRSVGREFFRSLVRCVADAMSVKYVLAGELEAEGTRARTLAAWADGPMEDFEFALANTPCERALQPEGWYCSGDIQSQFPKDGILAEMKARGFCGAPLIGSSGQLLGLLAVADDKPLIEPEERARALLSIFAARAAAELERLRVENALREHEENLQELVRERTSELVQAKERAEHANRAKSVFLSSMSHELRTPLNAILGFAQVLAREPDLAPRQRENLGIILKSGEHLLAIINDILDLAKIESGKVELDLCDFDLGDLTGDLISMLRVHAEAKGLELILDQSSSFPRFVRTDPAKLRQIIINLAGNAIKFTQKGRVSIKLSVQAVEAADQKKRLFFSVSDTGIGIPARDLDRIFHPFVQLAQNEGTGLGLAITQQYVQMLGGSISVSSEEDKGSTFTFTVVYEPADPGRVPLNPAAKAGNIIGFEDAANYRILVVEDQLENRLLLNKLLTPCGFQVSEAADGKAGVELCASVRPHVVFMDRRMPVLDGISATRAIRELPDCRDIIIIAVTAHAFRDERQEMLDAGCNDFLAKPFSDKQLFEMLEKHLSARAIRSEKPSPEPAPARRELDREAVGRLPANLRFELVRALERADMNAIGEFIQIVARDNPALAAAFQNLADRFDYASLLEALK